MQPIDVDVDVEVLYLTGLRPQASCTPATWRTVTTRRDWQGKEVCAQWERRSCLSLSLCLACSPLLWTTAPTACPSGFARLRGCATDAPPQLGIRRARLHAGLPSAGDRATFRPASGALRRTMRARKSSAMACQPGLQRTPAQTLSRLAGGRVNTRRSCRCARLATATSSSWSAVRLHSFPSARCIRCTIDMNMSFRRDRMVGNDEEPRKRPRGALRLVGWLERHGREGAEDARACGVASWFQPTAPHMCILQSNTLRCSRAITKKPTAVQRQALHLVPRSCARRRIYGFRTHDAYFAPRG